MRKRRRAWESVHERITEPGFWYFLRLRSLHMFGRTFWGIHLREVQSTLRYDAARKCGGWLLDKRGTWPWRINLGDYAHTHAPGGWYPRWYFQLEKGDK